MSRQAAQSSYMLGFQVPGLHERLYGGPERAERVRGLLRSFGAPPTAVEQAVDLYSDRERLRAMLQWYRALPLSFDRSLRRPCTVPTTYAWSTEDAALSRAAAERTAHHVTGPYRFEVLPGVSHWLPDEVPETVAELIRERVAPTT